MNPQNRTRHDRSNGRRYCRSGIHVVEVTMAMMLLTSLLVVVLAFNHQLRGVRQSVLQRTVVLQQSSNLLERLFALPYEQLSADNLPEIGELLDPTTVPAGVSYAISVTPDPEQGVIEISVLAQWNPEVGPPRRPVQLSAWKYEGR